MQNKFYNISFTELNWYKPENLYAVRTLAGLDANVRRLLCESEEYISFKRIFPCLEVLWFEYLQKFDPNDFQSKYLPSLQQFISNITQEHGCDKVLPWLPPTVTHLKMHGEFSGDISSLHKHTKLQHISLGHDFNKSLTRYKIKPLFWPDSFLFQSTHLSLGCPNHSFHLNSETTMISNWTSFPPTCKNCDSQRARFITP